MKNVLIGGVAAFAMIASTGAGAQTHSAKNTEYASSASIAGNPTTYNAPTQADVNSAEPILALGAPLELGTRIITSSTASDDVGEVTQRIDTVFSLSGSVNKDCSFYAGNTAAARTINFGTIGVRAGNNENVNAAFEMAGPATAAVETMTAGCNTNNAVELSKNDIRGLVNNNPGGYDSAQFQANIPYSVKASWTGVAVGTVADGGPQSVEVPTDGNANQVQQGAWRSKMNINFTAPAITDKGLVAGSYAGTTTLTLRAL